MITKTPERYKQASLFSERNTAALRKVKSIFTEEGIKPESAGRCLILSGAPGCGKTYSLWAAFNRLERWRNPIYPPAEYMENVLLGEGESRKPVVRPYRGIYGQVMSPDWFNDYLFAEPEYKKGMIEAVKAAPVLLIDDLGMEGPNEKVMALLESILNYRYNENKTTIISTNLTSEMFKKKYSERIIDRVREWGTFYEITEKSLRGEVN